MSRHDEFIWRESLEKPQARIERPRAKIIKISFWRKFINFFLG